MILYENYEEAIDIACQGDGLCDTMVIELNGYMISDLSKSDSKRPLWPFDMQFLFVSMAKFLATQIGHKFKINLPELQRIKVANIPLLTTGIWPSYDFVSMGFASKYVDYVRSHEVSDGKLFDIDFALHIACMALTKEDFDEIRVRIEAIEQLPNDHVSW